MNMKIFSHAILYLGLFSSLTIASQEMAPSSERGQQTWLRVGCYQCHGTDGHAIYAGRTWPPKAIARYIRKSPTWMPGYPEEVLSEDEIADIVAFMETIQIPLPADSIDVLKDLKPTN
jgi:mono/diheme cytochrome c family protein